MMTRRTLLAGIAVTIAPTLPAWSAPIDPTFPYVVSEIEAMTREQATQVRCISCFPTPAERDAWIAVERERALQPPRPYQAPEKLADFTELSRWLNATMRMSA